MRITVVRSGGFAGLQSKGVLETADAPDRAEIEQHARTARAQIPTLTGSAPQPDRFVYAIAIDDTRVRIAEPDLTDPLKWLVTRAMRDSGPLSRGGTADPEFDGTIIDLTRGPGG